MADARERQARYRARQKERGAPRPFLREQHGMTEADYAAMMNAQGGVCAVCFEPPGLKSLHIDHDHSHCGPKKSCVDCRRSLLCIRCNMALGLLRDNPETTARLAEYVVRFATRGVA